MEGTVTVNNGRLVAVGGSEDSGSIQLKDVTWQEVAECGGQYQATLSRNHHIISRSLVAGARADGVVQGLHGDKRRHRCRRRRDHPTPGPCFTAAYCSALRSAAACVTVRPSS
ncbi:uncharacterized protein LOC122387767 [Amphibalanus amphitrite]|uniref:uncharacterized protein LOC122387767 n=1 Tax=Amphibalanus amphitrite TaxID=1232801 RepID=UPI001C902B16|nr:uncharacterized protein LOC122387767 [Amphibalanus amphitrite]